MSSRAWGQTALASWLLGATFWVQAAPPLPEAATLTYALQAKASGFNVDVDSTLRWKPDGNRYTVVNEGRFLFFSFVWVSEGQLHDGRLQPRIYREKRNKREKITRFDAEGKRIQFNGGNLEPWRPEIQDRLSVLLTLSALGQAQPERLKPGATFTVPVAGSSRSDNWHFTVQDTPVLETKMGKINTLRLRRSRDDDDGQQIEVWLAPSHDWLPVRVLSREADGDYLDQTIKAIRRP